MGIEVLDHVIVRDGWFISLKERKLSNQLLILLDQLLP
jgi:hypothetical protein